MNEQARSENLEIEKATAVYVRALAQADRTYSLAVARAVIERDLAIALAGEALDRVIYQQRGDK